MKQLELFGMPNKEGKSFLKWAGGKGQLIGQISAHLPSDINNITTYAEPFVGSGAVMFWMLSKFQNIERVVINDINSELIKTYNAIKYRVNELIDNLESLDSQYKGNTDIEVRKSFFYDRRDEFNSCDDKSDDVRVAALFIFLNRTCFNGLYRVNSKNKFNVPFGKYANPKICDKDNLLADNEILKKVDILNGDFEATADYGGDNSFFYFDPPYKPISETSSFNSYAQGGFDDSEQRRLKEFCDALGDKGTKVMVSNSDPRSVNENDTFFDELYGEYNIIRVDAKRNINSVGSKRGQIKELLITNYR